MPELESDAGWATDVAVHELSGATVEDLGDHLVVRSPLAPTYHWGNCILVRDVDAADDPDRWLGVFLEAFPTADWIALGLRRMPADPTPWSAHGVELELIEVLAASGLPRLSPLPDGYEVRRLTGDDDWAQTVSLAADENARTGRHDPVRYEAFARERSERSWGLSDREDEVAAFFGAFAGGVLAAQLGIVRCDGSARYQNVLTGEGHRRRGLASHLVGVAARWAADRDCGRWVIVTETTNPALRVYRSVGFGPEGTNVQAYRRAQGR
jgi:GNAT superfamily N-acetyltransferase